MSPQQQQPPTPQELRRGRERAGKIRMRRWTRAATATTWQERRAIYLLEAGKLDLFRAEFPDGAPKP